MIVARSSASRNKQRTRPVGRAALGALTPQRSSSIAALRSPGRRATGFWVGRGAVRPTAARRSTSERFGDAPALMRQRHGSLGIWRSGGIASSASARDHSAQAVCSLSAKYMPPTVSPHCQRPSLGAGRVRRIARQCGRGAPARHVDRARRRHVSCEVVPNEGPHGHLDTLTAVLPDAFMEPR